MAKKKAKQKIEKCAAEIKRERYEKAKAKKSN